MTLVTGLNQILIESTTSDKFASCWFGLYRHDSRKLISVNAGHNPPYIFCRGNGKPRELYKGGLFLGVMDMPYENEEVQLNAEDVLVFFSDGVTEAWNEKQEEYEEYRLTRIVDQQLKNSASLILAAIERDVSQHVGKAKQSDDFTCAVVKIL